MKRRLNQFIIIVYVILIITHSGEKLWAQTGKNAEADLPAVKVAFSDDQSIITERVLYTALKRSGYQMIAKGTGMRTSIADVNYGDAAILPAQTDGFERIYENLIKVPVIIDYVEFTAYSASGKEYNFSGWRDLAGLRVGFRWQNEYVANNVGRARAAGTVRVNEIAELWDLILNDDVDVVILPRFTHFEHRFPQGVRRVNVIERQPVYSYVNNRYSYLVPLLEKTYTEMINDGTMMSIYNGEKPSGDKQLALHLNSYNAQNEFERSQMEAVYKYIESKTNLEYYTIYLNTNEPHSQVNFNSVISEMIRTEFISRYPDLIIASGDEAFEFVLNNYYLLFPNIPVLFYGASGLNNSVLYGLEDYITGVCDTVAFFETASEMLKSYPGTSKIYILNGNYLSRSLHFKESIMSDLHALFRQQSKPLDVIFSEDKPLPQILQDISGFGHDTLVLIGNYFSDSEGTFYSEAEIQRLVSNASVNPVYCLSASYIGHGTLGGFVPSKEEKSDIAATMAVDILKGKPVKDIPIVYDSVFLNKWQFDNNIIKRFNINKRNLPVGYILINRALPIWESNPSEFKLLLTILILFLLITIGLVLFFIRNSRIMLRISRQKELFETMNRVSSILLEPEANRRFEDTLHKAMDIMAEAVDVDRICIWMKNSEPRLCFTLNFQWENGDFKSFSRNGALAPDIWFDAHQSWNDILMQGNCINSLVRDMPPSEQEELAPRNILSLFVVPVFLQDQFWGYIGFDSCKKEFLFTNNEEMVLRSASRMLANAIVRREMTLQLENSAKDANNANKAKSTFLANMSHEIRTPMNAILGIAEIQLRDENLSRETEEAIEKIYESGDLLLNIINDILDLSKIEAGKLELVPVKYDIPSLINDSVQLNRLRYDSKPIDLSIHVDENTPHDLFGDELRIKQVMNNILSNAFKYTDEGTVAINISAESDNVESDDVVLVFRICDTGHGMTEKQLEELFDEYTRFNAEANRETVGTGLGMSITKHLLVLMRGVISVKSEPGSGTEFIVRIPQKRVGTEICGKELSEKLKNFNFRSSALMNKTQFLREYMPYGSVLVVDDVESNIYVIKGMLLPYGIKIDSASSGFEAIKKVEEGNVYDIVFMDHMMPKMDGIETTKRMRDLGYTYTIVALTANALIGRAEMFLQNGFDGFISKPIDSRELNAMLNELIRNKKPPEVIEAVRYFAYQHKNNAVPGAAKRISLNEELIAAAAHDVKNALGVLEDLFSDISADNIDMPLFTTTVHGIKSALANIGENQLSNTALALEHAGDSRDTKSISADIYGFMDSLRSFLDKIKPSKKDNGENDLLEVSDGDIGFLENKLNELMDACDRLMTKDAKNIMNDIKLKIWPQKIDEFLNEISLLILRGEYSKVVSSVEDAIKSGTIKK